MLSRGSEWHRWEPHIHAPGTLMNDQFKGPTAWDDYLRALERATPAIEAIAVTDYYVTETYERVVEYKKDGRLPSVRLVFPNVELRLDVATAYPEQSRAAPSPSPASPCCPSVHARGGTESTNRAFGAQWTSRPAHSAPVGNERNVERPAHPFGNRLLQAPRARLAPGSIRCEVQPPSDSPDVSVHGQGVPAERIEHHAARRLCRNAGEAREVALDLVVG